MLPLWSWDENNSDDINDIVELERSGKEEDIDEVENDEAAKHNIKNEFVPFNR